MNQAWLVAVREVRERGRSRVFVVSVLLMLVGAAGAIALPAVLDTGTQTRHVVLGFLVSFATFGNIDSTWARLVSWFPVTAPLAMPFRVAMGVATWSDLALAVALTLATIVGLIALGGRIYTHAILDTGGSLTLRQAWRRARHH